MQLTFDHLGLVVKSLGAGRQVLTATLGIEDWTTVFNDPVNGVAIQFGRDTGGVCYELLEPLDDKSPVFSALISRKAILNHVAYRVRDLESGAGRLMRSGCAPTSKPKPAVAYDGKRIQFFVTPAHFVIELVEAWEHRHRFEPWPRRLT